MSGTKRGRLLAKTGVLFEKNMEKQRAGVVGALKKNVENFDRCVPVFVSEIGWSGKRGVFVGQKERREATVDNKIVVRVGVRWFGDQLENR